MSAVIDKKAFDKISEYIARREEEREDPAGRRLRRRRGLLHRADAGRRRQDPDYRLLCEEIFGPVVTAYVYPDAQVARDARDRRPHVAVRADRRGLRARSRRRFARRRARCATRPATSTSTTSRPARSSASSRSAARAPRARTTRPARSSNLMRWVSARTIKETLAPPHDHRYPFMGAE